jgi:hypothetical protein
MGSRPVCGVDTHGASGAEKAQHLIYRMGYRQTGRRLGFQCFSARMDMLALGLEGITPTLSFRLAAFCLFSLLLPSSHASPSPSLDAHSHSHSHSLGIAPPSTVLSLLPPFTAFPINILLLRFLHQSAVVFSIIHRLLFIASILLAHPAVTSSHSVKLTFLRPPPPVSTFHQFRPIPISSSPCPSTTRTGFVPMTLVVALSSWALPLELRV